MDRCLSTVVCKPIHSSTQNQLSYLLSSRIGWDDVSMETDLASTLRPRGTVGKNPQMQ